MACSESRWATICRSLPQARAGTFRGEIQPDAQGLGDAGGRPPRRGVTRGPSPPGLAPDNPSSSIGCLPHPGPHRGSLPCHLALWAQQTQLDNEGDVTGGFVFRGAISFPLRRVLGDLHLPLPSKIDLPQQSLSSPKTGDLVQRKPPPRLGTNSRQHLVVGWLWRTQTFPLQHPCPL